ncbi:MAG TPA: DUF885 domain-containing protein [Bryobacterales bacterium]|nr:DUF885 domain-containing protein [Bryobacterales bacterium]
MRKHTLIWPAVFMCLTAAGCSTPQEKSATPAAPSPEFARFVDDYFNAAFEWSPSSGTEAGFHQYDTKIEDLAAAAFAKRIDTLHSELARLEELRKGTLAPDDEIDAEILDGQIRSELLDLETLQTWKKNPMRYVGLPGGVVDDLMKRDFAPAHDRLQSLVARLQGVPATLEAMKANVSNPPKEFTDLAIRMAGGSVGFFRKTVADWAKQAAGPDQALLQQFTKANDAAAKAVEQAAAWLKKDLLPQSKGAYAIGAENFSKKLAYDEMVDLPLDRVLAIGEANLEKDYRDFVDTAKKIDPTKSPSEVMKSLEKDHPTAQSLIPSAKDTLAGIRQYVADHKIIDLPSEARPIVTETPPYARSGSFASMDSPGPYETKATEAFYYVTPPEKSWDARHVEEHLRLYNRPVMDIITIHEVYPGHFVQFLYSKQFPTKTRKLIFCSSNVEGWAHYGEQMMLEEGYGGGDPKIRLAQLEEALLRDCRYLAGIRLHTRGMTVQDGAKIFVEKGFQEPANAYEEARRGAYNPTYLYYTLGKLEIYKLREDYRKAKGAAFSLREFHDQFVKQGGIPIKLIRRILLPGDQGAVL